MARKEILQFLDTVGDGSGTTDMSAAADTYKFTPTSGRGWAKIAAIKLFIMDGGAFQEDFYGHLGAAIVNGCTCKIVKQAGGDELDLIAAGQFKDNADMRRSGWTFEVQTFAAGNNWVVAVFRPPVDFDRALVVYEDEELEFDVQDDLSGLVAQNVVIFGEYER
jgi:hypothetical protein